MFNPTYEICGLLTRIDALSPVNLNVEAIVEAVVEAVRLTQSTVEAIKAILSTSARKKVTLNFQFCFLGFTVC
ncbi:hypothetical protein [Stanieria cyanosphaera]|uniref:hypothetical protein n=1 Tax=Stanieria cyanosphaera TaxID=102116 RepID=UPI0002F50035|nr:hypothetical protein [Stanieria cyanosphaera]